MLKGRKGPIPLRARPRGLKRRKGRDCAVGHRAPLYRRQQTAGGREPGQQMFPRRRSRPGPERSAARLPATSSFSLFRCFALPQPLFAPAGSLSPLLSPPATQRAANADSAANGMAAASEKGIGSGFGHRSCDSTTQYSAYAPPT